MRLIGSMLVVTSVFLVAMHWVSEWAAVDSCLDSGGVYDYATNRCRSDINTLPYLSYTERFGWKILTAFIFSLVGILLIAIAKSRGSTN